MQYEKIHTFLSSEIFKAFFQCNWFGGSLKVEKKIIGTNYNFSLKLTFIFFTKWIK